MIPELPPPGAKEALAAAVAAWREGDGQQAEPWRVHFVEALLRRAQSQQGLLRRQLEDRVRQAMAGGARAVGAAASTQPARPRPASPPPLAALRAHVAQAVAARGAPPQEAASAPELEAVRRFRQTWSRLSVEQRVRQARAKVPAGAGPLNTQRLVHEALDGLRQASPAYLHRLMVQVEALLWLEQAAQAVDAPAPAKASASRAPRPRSERRPPGAGAEAPASRPKR